METTNQPASPKQKLLIQNIYRERGVERQRDVESLTFEEAKILIDSLLGSRRTYKNQGSYRTGKIEKNIDEVRLGLATKLVYNNWRYNVCAIVGDNELKDRFIEEVLGTYKIIQEINKRAREMQIG